MKYNPAIHKRRSIRLQGYDYSAPGAYFITICAYQRECWFGEVVDGSVELNALGKIVRSNWQRLPYHFPSLTLDEFVVMPNHVHGILQVDHAMGKGEAFGRKILGFSKDFMPNASPLQISDDMTMIPNGTKPGSIAAMIQNFKSTTTRRINQIRKTTGVPVWQRNYYERIIRDETALQTIRHYIQNNPLAWMQDQLHPQNPSKW